MAGRFILVAACIVGLVPTAFGQLSNRDRTFVMDAAQSNNFQIKAALLANQYSSNPVYRQYATDIANAQTEDTGQLESTVALSEFHHAATQQSVARRSAPVGCTEKLEKCRCNISECNDFAPILPTIRMYQHYIEQPDANEGLKQMAQELLPKFEQHLEDARDPGVSSSTGQIPLSRH